MRHAALEQFSLGSGELAKDNIFAGKVKEADNFSVMMLLDLDNVNTTIKELTQSFPDHFLHTFAAKANPIRVSNPYSSLLLLTLCR